MKTHSKSDLFRELPSIDELSRAAAVENLIAAHGSPAVIDAARAVLAELRQQISSGLIDASGLHLALGGIEGAIEKQVHKSLSPSLRTVINATGVILHTNLGRAPIAEEALRHI